MRFIMTAVLISCAVSEHQQCVDGECDDSIAMLRVEQKAAAAGEKLHPTVKKSGGNQEAMLQTSAANYAQRNQPARAATRPRSSRPLRKSDFASKTLSVAPN